MGISDLIASFLQESLEETDGGVLEVQRNDLAQRFNCVPSQINYVMSTRFSPERGYIVESRRGGNGYIRITRVRVDRQTLLMQVMPFTYRHRAPTGSGYAQPERAYLTLTKKYSHSPHLNVRRATPCNPTPSVFSSTICIFLP